MAEFIRMGRTRINVEAIRSVHEDTNGEVVLGTDNGTSTFPPDEGKALLEWADSLVSFPKHDAKEHAKDVKHKL